MCLEERSTSGSSVSNLFICSFITHHYIQYFFYPVSLFLPLTVLQMRFVLESSTVNSTFDLLFFLNKYTLRIPFVIHVSGAPSRPKTHRRRTLDLFIVPGSSTSRKIRSRSSKIKLDSRYPSVTFHNSSLQYT